MAANGRKRCRKSKLEVREGFEMEEEDFLYMQHENEHKDVPKLTAVARTPVNVPAAPAVKVNVVGQPTHKPVPPPSPSKLQKPQMDFVVDVKVEEYSEDINHDWSIANSNPGSSKEPTYNLANCEPREYTTNRLAILQAVTDILIKSINPADIYLANRARNYSGRFVNTIVKKIEDRIIQKGLEVWNIWYVLNSDVREAPLLHKCYICGLSWWYLREFRKHISKHVKEEHFRLIVEVERDTSYLVCVKQNTNRAHIVGPESSCYRCGKSAEYHLSKKGIFKCEGCDKRMLTCTQLASHEGVCAEYKTQCLPLLETYSQHEIYKCIVCLMKFYNRYELDAHKSRSHSVRSDLVVPWSVKQCNACQTPYILFSLHTCPKKTNMYGCTACGTSFQKKVFKEIHFKSCSDNFMCTVCNKQFKRQCMQPMHMLLHTEKFILLYRCIECGNERYFPDELSISFHTLEEHKRMFERKFKYIEMVVLPKQSLKFVYRPSVSIPCPPLAPLSTNEKGPKKIKLNESDTNTKLISNLHELTEEITIKQEIDIQEQSVDVESDADSEMQAEEIPTDLNMTIKCEKPGDSETLQPSDDTATEELSNAVATVLDDLPEDFLQDQLDTDFEVSTGSEFVCEKNAESNNEGIVNSKDFKVKVEDEETIDNGNKYTEKDQFVLDIKVEADDRMDVNDCEFSGCDVNIKQEQVDQVQEVCMSGMADVQIKMEKDTLSQLLEASGIAGLQDKTEPDEDSFDEEMYEDDLIIIGNKPDETIVLSDDDETADGSADDGDGKEYEGNDEHDQDYDTNDDIEKDDDSDDSYETMIGRRNKKVYNCNYCAFKGTYIEFAKHRLRECEVAIAKRNARKQKQQATATDEFQCTTCSYKAINLRAYLKHFTKIHKYKKFTCPQCFNVYDRLDRLVSHVRVHINKMYIKIRMIEETLERTKGNGCRFCQTPVETEDFFTHWEHHIKIRETSEEGQVVEHEAVKEDVTPVYTSKVAQKILDVLLSPNVEASPKQCVICARVFSRQNDTKRHLIEHLLEEALARRAELRAIRCQLCGEGFARPDRYKYHMRDHASLPIYKCDLCAKSFSDSSNFAKHKKVHNLAELKCDICGKSFHIASFLAKHMEMHKQTKPKECKPCGKIFYTESSYKKHTKHSHERHLMKFTCNICKMSFGRLREKWDHEWLVHKARKLEADCPICDESFRRFLDVKMHVREAHDMDFMLFKNHPLLRERAEEKERREEKKEAGVGVVVKEE